MKHFTLTLICAVAATTALSQSDPTSSRTLTLAPADAPSSGAGGAGADDEKAKAAALAKATLNPIALQLGGRYYAEGPSGAPEWGCASRFRSCSRNDSTDLRSPTAKQKI